MSHDIDMADGRTPGGRVARGGHGRAQDRVHSGRERADSQPIAYAFVQANGGHALS